MKADSILEFYRAHKVSPVRQGLGDLSQHFARRRNLYTELGIPPRSIRGRSVIEVGPGGGANALFTASHMPERYVLVEPNERGREDIRSNFASFPEWASRIEIKEVSLQEYHDEGTYDVVLCEGMLTGVSEPASALRRLAALLDNGGVLVATCIDPISSLAENLRRLLAWSLIDRGRQTLDEMVNALLPYFSPQLNTIAGMSRPHDDWVIDNLLVPAEAMLHFLSVPTIIAAVPHLRFYSSCPKFSTAWRWYKDPACTVQGINDHAVENYWQTAHNLLDYRDTFPARDARANQELDRRCGEFGEAIKEAQRNAGSMIDAGIIAKYADVVESARGLNHRLDDSLEQGMRLMERFLDDSPPSPSEFSESPAFAGWFGRCQMYVSLIAE